LSQISWVASIIPGRTSASVPFREGNQISWDGIFDVKSANDETIQMVLYLITAHDYSTEKIKVS
jgi:hypothetical protein